MQHLSEATYVNIRTFKPNGDPVASPVWLAIVDDKLYFGTPAHTHKVKRIADSPSVEIAACDSRGNTTGAWHQGTARRLTAEEFKVPKQAIDGRHPVSSRLLSTFARIRRWDYIGFEVRMVAGPPKPSD